LGSLLFVPISLMDRGAGSGADTYDLLCYASLFCLVFSPWEDLQWTIDFELVYTRNGKISLNLDCIILFNTNQKCHCEVQIYLPLTFFCYTKGLQVTKKH
jgi:hypothetical protein